MALNSEIEDQDDKVVYLLPQDLACSVSTIALGKINSVLQFTAGGSISIVTGFLLTTFPQLYDATG